MSNSQPRYAPVYSEESLINITDLELFKLGHPFDAYGRLSQAEPPVVFLN
jgi:hypothetical protein